MSRHGQRLRGAAEGVYGLTLQTGPATEPLSLTDAKAHLRVDTADENDYIDDLITSARQYAETFMRRSIIDQTWDMFLDGFPPDDQWIEPPNPRLKSVATVKFNQEVDGLQVTMPSADYIVDVNREPGRIALAFDKIWPDARDQINAVEIRFVAGYGPTDADVPDEIRQAIKIMVSHLFEIREPVIVGTIISKVPRSADDLLRHHKTFGT